MKSNNKPYKCTGFAKWLLPFLLICIAVKGFAVEEPYVNELKGTQVVANNFFTVSDEKFNSPSSWSLIQQNISVDNILTFEINFDTTIYFHNQPFQCTANFKIYIYGNQSDTSEITDSTTHSNITLDIRYDTITGKPYKGIALYKFKNAHKFKVKILSITSPQLDPIPAIFRVKAQIIVNRKYNFSDNSTDVTRYSLNNDNQLQLAWTPSLYPGAEMFDLEYTYIDKNSQIATSIASYVSGDNYNVPPDSLAKWFKNNSSRITTAAASYLVNLSYDSGFVLFRIRGVQVHYPDDLRWEGNWNYYARESSSSSCTPPSCPTGVVLFDGHEQNLNWQFSISFAEEGKRKEVISYFDGSLRNRQSVTISNSDNKSVIQETVYDALGRPAASILPAPTDDSTIHYFRGFNKNKHGDPYSFSDLLYGVNCLTTADSLSHLSGTGRYYSTSNPFQNTYLHAMYIPNAGGYPLAVTEYMADNTGRIKAQGGVGPTFQLGQNHDTKYFYGKPTQTELDRLFGSEAGNASHYLKNMVQDANGQLSVSYQDASGKTIATALAGAAPSNVHSLPSGSGASVQVSNELIQPGDFIRNPTDFSLSATATFLAPVTGNYIFNYKVDPLVYQKLFGPAKDSSICSDCYYDLEITIKDDCNNLIDRDTVAAGIVFDTSCVNLPDTLQGLLDVTLEKIGEYYITYTLRISEEALNFYDSVHLVKNSDLKKLNYFLLEELKETDFYGCYSSCETCFDKLGTQQEFVATFKSLYTADSLVFGIADSLYSLSLYDSLYANCQAIQSQCALNICDEKLALLKLDVSPGGQYALFDSSYNLLEFPINRLAMRDQISYFTNEFGVRDSILLYTGDGEDSVKVDVTELTDSQFIEKWKDAWADSLVRLHPEYCYYLWCVANSTSYEFDREVENLLDADTAVTNGWFDPAVYYKLLDADPFFSSNAGRYNKMKKALQQFSRRYVQNSQPNKNILQFVDIVLYCKTQYNGWVSCNPDSSCRSRNREWFMYKTLYLNLKQKFYEDARRADTLFASCTNCHIGDDLLGGSGLGNCVAPPKSNFSISLSGCTPPPFGSVVSIKYKEGVTSYTESKYTIELRGHIIGGASFLQTVSMPAFSNFLCINIPALSEIDSIERVYCDTTLWAPFSDSLCNYSCPGGIYTPYDRDTVTYYIEYGNPDSLPSGTPENYGNCKFYPVFDLYTSADSSCRFFNVWVCEYDSTCGGICPPDTSYSSSCPATSGSDTLYRNKQRRYPEYLNPDELLNSISSGNPQQGSGEQDQIIMDECRNSCDAQADYWIRTLQRCNISPEDSVTLRAALVEICSTGCSMNAPFGTSSIPSSVSASYHSFEEAIEGILGPGAINDSCTAELLAMPYPHDKQPVLTERVITETDYDICQRIGQYRSAYNSSGFAGSLHQFIQSRYGASYTLDSTDLYDLVNSCLNCNGILKNDIVLPVMFDPQSKPCLDCDSVTVALADFNDKFPAITTDDDDYEILFTNFFNHRFGFALTYDGYKTFLDSCAANGSYAGLLCNAPVTEDVAGDDNSCMQELFATALTNATSTYIAYIDSVRRDFRDAWTTKCMNVQPRLKMTADLYEYHYTLYYYDQSRNLVKTVPPEGVSLLSDEDIEDLQSIRNGTNPFCSNNNAMEFTGGSVNFPGGTNAPHLNVGADPFTIETWINLKSYSNQGILSNNHYTAVGTFNTGYSLDVISSKLVLTMGESSAAYKVEAASPDINAFMGLNSWSHLAVQRTSASTVKMYINGNEIPVTYISNSPNTGNLDHAGTDAFYTGASNKDGTVSAMISGGLRHLRIYKRALPAAEIRQNSMDYCGNPSGYSSLVFWETFNEGSFTSSGGNNYVYERIYSKAGQKSGNAAFTINSNALVPEHRLVTTYQYNSLNQVLQQYSPDADTSVFFYDRLGRLTVSQNKEQKENSSYSGTANRFSYTTYDALGRINEVGEKSGADDIRTINMLDTTAVKNWLVTGTDKQITKTIYDTPINLYQSTGTSRKRVVASIYLENDSDTEGDSTLYAYDILGNVNTLVQHVKALVAVDATNGKKQIDYAYDLASGKVNMVSYQPGKGDQFFYKYQYDADNRVTRSYSSRDKLLWIEDASYNYYLHGPLARTELGQYKVQGIDYAYTLQGWLKGINGNALNPEEEMGQDGNQSSVFERVSKDVYSYGLGYYNGDYTAISSSATAMTQALYQHPGGADNTGRQLFNGNISHTEVALSKIDNGSVKGYSYGYDQLNRLVFMNQHNISGSTWNNSNIISAYAESIAHDANGNILQYLRKGANGSAGPLDMDSLNYKYNRDLNGNIVNNRLNHVRDAVGSGNYAVDIDDQSNNNYTYDLIGNLKTDAAETISTINWTVYGKIKSITKTNTDIDYGYDPGGNRTHKKVIIAGGESDEITNTWYIRDAQGNTLAVYSKKNSEAIKWNEQHLYGSSRLGMWNWDTIVPAEAPIVGSGGTPIYDSLLLGSRTYELSNHLGNVLVTISDKKMAEAICTDGIPPTCYISSYIAEVISANDYYPFGMMQPGREYSANSDYRYGFNGKEKDNETNTQDYGMRIYDPRLGRFLSVDPLSGTFPWYSPYHFAGNNPVRNIDLDGGEPKDFVRNWMDRTMTINENRSAIDERETDKLLGVYSYKAIYDKTTQQHWFVMQVQNDPTYYYWKHIDGADPNRLIQSKSGKLDNGTWASFETQDAIQARVRTESAELIGTMFYVLFTAPFIIEASVNVAPAFASTAKFAIKNFGRSFIEEVSKQLIGNGGDISKVDFFDVLSNTAASKFKLNIGQKEFVELLNSGFDFTIENGASDVFGATKKKDKEKVGADFLFSQLSIFGSEILDEKSSKLFDIFLEKSKNELNKDLEKLEKKDK